MPKRISQVKTEVISAIGKTTYDKIISHVRRHPPVLWGAEKPRGFLEKMTMLTLWKDVTATGFQKTLTSVNLGSPLTHRSFSHNVAVIRATLKDWGRSTVNLGSIGDWTRSMRNVKLSKSLKMACLWMDLLTFRWNKDVVGIEIVLNEVSNVIDPAVISCFSGMEKGEFGKFGVDIHQRFLMEISLK
jgi:hypothetical protein